LLRLNVSAALLTMLPVTLPVVPALPLQRPGADRRAPGVAAVPGQRECAGADFGQAGHSRAILDDA
jgi:hypothetical protein